MDKDITFDRLPEAVAYLIEEVKTLRAMVAKLQPQTKKHRQPISIDEACLLIMKAKPTVYAMVHKGLIPCYKSGQKLYFYEEELMEWIAQGKKLNMAETKAKIEAEMQSSVRHRPQKRFI